jgi:hypothetical protein
MSESERAEEAAPPDHDVTRPNAHDPYRAPPKHDPAFPSWRYAGLRWLADRLYGEGRSKN